MADTDDFENTPPRDQPVATGSSAASGPTGTCAGCGLPLLRRGPKGECLRCLMDFAFSPEDEESPAKPPEKTTWRYGHFEIAVGADGHPIELGAGAMATTYRATDSVLHSDVALKVINQTVAEHPTARARFLREARAAAKLHHPNVASVSHYGEQDGECYYVMELVEGETLETRVRRVGPLPPSLVLEIGIQVARALAAAEACGVVHRDLKPSNIMLMTPQGEEADIASTVVKVIDWGLAKAVSAESVLGTDHTHGGFVGTPAFASPEQFSRDRDRRVDNRSDIYSLGVTLWYLLCGKTPFSGTTLEEIHSRQIKQPIPFAQLAAARVPEPIVTLLKSMMAVDPTARPQSARELLDALRNCKEALPGEQPAHRSRPRSRRRFLVTLVVLLLLSAGIAGPWWYHWNASRVPSDKSVAVLPLNDLGPDPAADAIFVADVHEKLTSNLASIAGLKVIERSSVREYAPGKRDLPAIGRALGVGHLLEGGVRRQEGKISLHVWMVNAANGGREWEQRYTASASEIFDLESRVTRAVADFLRSPPSAAEAAVINQPPTANLQAWDIYLRAAALPRLSTNAAGILHSIQQRNRLLEEAIKLDPEFALAYARLGSNYDTLKIYQPGFSPEERAVDYRSLAEAAYAKARQLQPDLGQLHVFLGGHFFYVNHDLEQARVELDLARRTMPNDSDVEAQTARILRAQGRLEEAIVHYRRVVELDPRDPSCRSELYITYGYLRRYDDYEREVVAMIALLPPNAIPELHLCRALGPLASRADLAPLRKALGELNEEKDPGGVLRDVYGIVLALFDRDSQAVEHLLASSQQTRFNDCDFMRPKSWYAALDARSRGDADAARVAFTAARAEVDKTVQENPHDERNLLSLAMIDAGLGRKEEAVREALRACAMPSENMMMMNGASNRACLAVVYAWVGQPDDALAELDKLANQPAGESSPNQVTYGDLKLNPLWDPLRNDPRFDALLQRLAPPNLRP